MGLYNIKIANVVFNDETAEVIVAASYAHNEFPNRSLGAVSQTFPVATTLATMQTALNAAVTQKLNNLDKYISAKAREGTTYTLSVTGLTNEDAIIKRNVPE